MSLYSKTRACSACSLREACAGPVPAVGPMNAEVMLVGEAPGKYEDESGQPFTGDAGVYLDSLLQSIGVNRQKVVISNVVKCRPRSNKTPTSKEAEFCASRWLDQEVKHIQPSIIVAMGKVAIEHFLGKTSVEHVHGIPTEQGDVTVLPVYHPAAGFYDTSLMREIQQDFQVLGGLIKGYPPVRPVDDVPVRYEIGLPRRLDNLVALDTETVDGQLWSVQIADKPGESFFFRKSGPCTLSSREVVVHNYLFDAKHVGLPDDTHDTMLMAYLLGQPQGLKELAYRLCGMEMQSYQEIVSGHRREKSLAYLSEVQELEWPDPPVLEDIVWNKKSHQLEVNQKTPQNIDKKVKRIISDVESGKETKDGPTDPWARWHKIDLRERQAVVDVLGDMPDASLEDVDLETSVVPYAARDADATLRVFHALSPEIDRLGLKFVYGMDRATLPIALAMMKNGIKVNVGYLQGLGKHYLELMEAKAEDIFKTHGIDDPPWRFNPNSDMELRRLFFQHLGFKPTKFTPTGLPAVSTEELSKIKHPVVKLVEEYRHLAHLKDSFCDTLPGKADSDGRIHTTINVTRTATGRWSMKNPNLQQLPTRTEWGKAIRKGFVAEEGNVLVAIDYSQIEMRVAAHLAQCRSMIELFKEGRDIHNETAAAVFGPNFTSAHRYASKTLGFGVLYGLTAHGLNTQMQTEGQSDWTEDRCREFIREYFALRPEVGVWQEATRNFAKENGYVKDIFGRMRWTPEVQSPINRIKSAGERQAVNMPVQSTAQGIIKLAMAKLWKTIPESSWLLQIHDELLWTLEESEVDDFIQSTVDVMESVILLSVPIKAESKVGLNWGEMS